MAEAVQMEAPLEWDTPLYRQALTQFELALPQAVGVSGVSAGRAENSRNAEVVEQ